MISLNCFFFPEKINYVTLKLNDFKKTGIGAQKFKLSLILIIIIEFL